MSRAYDGKYNVGPNPTDDEWETYRRVFAYDQRENVALWLESNRPDATQEQFERTYEAYAELWRDDGEHDAELLFCAADEVMAR